MYGVNSFFTILADTANWSADAPCTKLPYSEVDAIFHTSYRGKWDQRAFKLCASCPVIVQCREACDKAEAGHRITGIHSFYAGETPRQRLARRKRIKTPARKFKSFRCHICGRNCSTTYAVKRDPVLRELGYVGGFWKREVCYLCAEKERAA